jgi:Skp family chaperone for outer membrane proteins
VVNLTIPQDFFYICAGHLTDHNFAIPDKDEVAAVEARKKNAELDAEIEKVKKEYSEKMRKKAEKRQEKEKDGKEKDGKEKDGKEKSKDEEKKEADEDNAGEKERDEKVRYASCVSM